MYHIGIDIGSTYTKYSIVDSNNSLVGLLTEQTPLRQKEYFIRKLKMLLEKYPDAQVVTCGYGRRNVPSVKRISELTALARGIHYQNQKSSTVLDIGGQDTKLIRQENGRLKEFFVNEKCAAGCGMFLANILHLLQIGFDKIDLTEKNQPDVKLSSVCAVFAQSEIIELLAEDVPEGTIILAVICQILTQAKRLLGKVGSEEIVLSGGMAEIKGIDRLAAQILGQRVIIPENAAHLSAIGCSVEENLHFF